MHQALPFFADFARVCAATPFVVANVAFVSLPHALDDAAGEPATVLARHLT